MKVLGAIAAVVVVAIATWRISDAVRGDYSYRQRDASFAATWSPDGSRLAFMSTHLHMTSNFKTWVTRKRDKTYVWVVDASGRTARKLAHGADPSWLRDGKRIAFNLFEGDATVPAVVNADGSGLRKLASWPVTSTPDLTQPVKSPDGRLAAVEHERRQTDEHDPAMWIDIVTSSGKRVASSLPARIRRGVWPFHEADPRWSPNGRTLAFVRTCCGRPGSGIYVMSRDGTGRRRLAKFGTHPRWSPDGRRIAFETPAWSYTDRPHRYDDGAIYVVNADGTGLRRVSPKP